jgi:NDP-sugar pyrophosphorylase family protein
MIIIIPLGGTGERFKQNGYKKPKALVNVFGKPILYYLLDNLNLTNVDFVFIPYNKEYSTYNFEETIQHDYPNINFKFKELKQNTGGAAETINIALKCLKDNDFDNPCLCLDGDNFYTVDVVKLWNSKNRIITFNDDNQAPIYSYIDKKDGMVLDIVEKQKISNHACSGAYGFASSKQLLEYTQKIIDNEIKQKGEYFENIKEKLEDIDLTPNEYANKLNKSEGRYFSTKKDTAKIFSKGEKGRVVEAEISKKDLAIDILTQIFNLNEDEKPILSKNIDFICNQKNLIKKVSFYKLFKTGLGEWFRKK